MRHFRPEKKALLTLRLAAAAIVAFLLIVARIYIPISVVVLIIAMFFAAVLIYVDFIYLPLLFRSLRYETTKDKITCHSGVIYKSSKTVRYSTVQYTTVVTTPFSKYTGLNFVILFVYGGQQTLLFLSKRDANEIMRLVSEADRKGDG